VKSVATWLSRHPYVLSLLLLTIVAVPGYLRMEQINAKTDHTVECVQDWADRTAERSAALSRVAQARTSALDELLRTVYFNPGNAELALMRLADYVQASNEYVEAARENPVPPSPELTCR
jgi:hypothetical protein